MSKKYALVIGNTEYTDPGLAQLTAPGKDAEDFAKVLKAPDIGAFDEVTTIINQDAATAREAIEEFFNEKTKDDLLVLYFSGHGVRDETGNLHLAVKNTKRSKLRSTGIESGFVRVAMDQSRSKRQVLILDCCNSGAFAQGTKAETGGSVGTATAFRTGSGQIILTASDSTQFAWEGDKVIGETDNSLFTHFLVKGIKGEADRDGDGQITVDELYDYVYEQVRLATPKQTPSKFSTKQQGEIVLRQGIRIEDIKPAPLPHDLLEDIDNPRSAVRVEAVQQLARLLNGKNLALARSAREALERIAENDDSRTISRTAFQALDAIRQVDELAKQKEDEARKKLEEDEARRVQLQKAETQRLLSERAKEAEHQEKEKAEQFAAQKAEETRLAQVKAEANGKAKEEADLLAAKKEGEERVAQAKTAFLGIKSMSSPATQKKPVSKRQVIGIVAVVILCVAGIGIGLNGFLKSGNQNVPASTLMTQAAVEVPTTEAPATPTLTNIAPASTSTIVPTPAPTLGIGSKMISEKDGMTLLYVPAGTFSMGAKVEETLGALAECKKFLANCQLSWFIDQTPLHEVNLNAFWIDETEVTNAMYAKCVKAGPCNPPSSTKSNIHYSYYDNSDYDNYPVINVSWEAAVVYCSWAGRELPTEAQWEKAARGKNANIYPWGSETPNQDLMNYNRNVGDTTEVGKYPKGKSVYGALDMAGNVWEWVSDWYDVYPGGAPNASSDFGQKYRVLRGGSWDSLAFDVHSAHRGRMDPSTTSRTFGFRCSRST